MATQYKTPGVYIQEPDSFPPSIVGVDTAVPAFIGYTQKATKDGRIVRDIPIRISSMVEFQRVFGGPYQELYYLSKDPPTNPKADLGGVCLDGKTRYHLVEGGAAHFYLYDCLVHFYANGGGDCYIVSCSPYQENDTVNPLDPNKLIDGLKAVENLIGPTMLLVPDAVLLTRDQYNNVIEEMLDQCARTGDRVALFDILGGDDIKWASSEDPSPNPIQQFRETLAGKPDELKYGIAYFPFLNTSVVQPTDISISNFDKDHYQTLKDALTAAVATAYPASGGVADKKGEEIRTRWVEAIGTSKPDYVDGVKQEYPAGTLTDQQLLNGLLAGIPAMGKLLEQIAAGRNILPPSPAMAGIYTTMDRERGVWNAPANVGINQLISPVVEIGSKTQEDLNVPTGGLAVNAIRTFPGRGALVWGARTLDGNSNDWRYIQVRRTMIYVEQSVKTALNAFVFAPNTASTWVTVTSMVESFLHGLWSAGGLMGATPAQAYNVKAGLGSTMTPDDVLNGIMRVQIILQMVHPAEFIELTFEQQMLGGS